MREYQRPDAEYVKFSTEAITDIADGDMDSGSLNDNNPLD